MSPRKFSNSASLSIFISSVFRIHKNLKGEWKSTGDPTEVALQVFASKVKLGRPSLTSDAVPKEEAPDVPAMGEVIEDDDDREKKRKLLFEDEDSKPKRFDLKTEYPFSSEVKMMTMIYVDHEKNNEIICCTKGAVRNLFLFVLFRCY